MDGVERGNFSGTQMVPNGNLKSYSCHQCRQKTTELVAACTSVIGARQCVMKFCHRCLWNRYKVNAADVVVLSDWICPKCRGLCNCSACRRRRGEEPMRTLSREAKEAGFSIKEMLNVRGPPGNVSVMFAGIELPPEIVGDVIQFLEFCASFREVFGIKKEQAEGIIRELIFPSSSHGQIHPLIVAIHYQLLSLIDKDQTDRSLSLSPIAEEEFWLEALGKCLSKSKYQLKNLPSDCFDKDGKGYKRLEASQKLKLLIFLCDEALCTTRRQGEEPVGLLSGKAKEPGFSSIEEMQNVGSPQESLIGALIPTKASVTGSRKTSGNENSPEGHCGLYLNAHNVIVEKDENDSKKRKESDVWIRFPQGNSSVTLDGIELPPENVGDAFQFLEFCASFGEVFGINKEHAEGIIKELIYPSSSQGQQHPLIVAMHYQLLSVIDKNQSERSLSPSAEDESWLEALGKCLSNSKYQLKNIPSDCFDKNGDGYNKLEASQKLELLIFLCNEALCTTWRRGEEPTGMLSHKAKEAGFSSIQEMWNAGSPQGSLSGSVTPTKDSVTVSWKKSEKENSPEGHCGLSFNEHNVIALKNENDSKKRKEFDDGIRLPHGNSSVTLGGIELPPENVGDAIQFLEFCASFGEVFGIKKEQAEGIVRELIFPSSSSQGQQHPLIVAMHYQLLSLIDKDQTERSLSQSPSAEEESWLEALGKCLSNSKYQLKNLPSDCFDKDGDGYEKLEASQKLKLLIFLCDEALRTTALGNYIDNKNSEFALNKKKATTTVLTETDEEKELK